MKKYLLSKKQKTASEVNWRQERHDQRWEIRVNYFLDLRLQQQQDKLEKLRGAIEAYRLADLRD